MAVLSPLQLTRTVRSRRGPRTGALGFWHLLSLDAPTVAALWTWFIAASVGIALPPASILAMAIAVWMLYAADRLLDARHLLSDPLHSGDLEHRHRFHHRHRSAFLAGILLSSIALAALLPGLHPRAIRLDLILGALLAGYFLLIHVTGSGSRLPKEIAVGLFFSAAVFIPTLARAPSLQPTLFPAAALFALLCSLNCLFIYDWEHPDLNSLAPPNPHPATRLALHHHLTLAALSFAANLLLVVLSRIPGSLLPPIPSVLPAACALSSASLLLLHRFRHTLSPLTLRAAADLALLTPLLLLPLLRHPPA